MHRNSVLVHAPLGRDAELVVNSLSAASVAAVAEVDFACLIGFAAAGNAGALLLSAECLTPAALRSLADVLSQQPHWSDLPILVLVPGGQESKFIAHMEAVLSLLPNLSLLERPIRPITLASVARNALRSRQRQYEVQRILLEKEQTAAAMVQSEKLAAVGRLASSIAHEINNPLEAVTNLLYIVRSEDGLPQNAMDYLDTADRELARVSQIVSQTLRFHRQSTSATAVRPEALLLEVLGIYKTRLVSSKIAVRQEFQHGIAVTCYEGDIRQVLSNLVGNAFDVMRTGGTLRLRTRECTRASSGLPGIMITVADDGPGMSPQTQARIFDAFYSTKGIQGTGLGLWISRRIVHKHGGYLRVRSRTGTAHGTVFRLWLPRELADSARQQGWDADGTE